MPIRLLIVENEGLFRDMLRVSLESESAFEIVGAVGDGQSVVLLAQDLGFGSLYTAGWIGWMSWSHTRYFASDGYDVEQLPVRVVVLAITAAMVMYLVSRLNQQRDREQERLHELEELEEMKSTLLRTVAHEVKSPITAVRAATDLSGVVLESEQRARVVNALQGGVRRLENIVRESLAYAELKGSNVDLHSEELDMGDLALDAVRALEPAALAKSQEIGFAAPMLSARLGGDPVRIERILLNLLSNAIKFTPDGGSITLTVRETTGSVVTEVANTGAPIPEAERERIFQEYYQGREPDRRDHGSVGLGLTVAKRLAEAHGGSLELRAGDDSLTTFALTLPSMDAASSEPNPA
jgi:signal transduction histidine kinase